jgi:hypothetical protein
VALSDRTFEQIAWAKDHFTGHLGKSGKHRFRFSYAKGFRTRAFQMLRVYILH